LRLIRKWLKAGVSEDGQWSETNKGTPQGAVASPPATTNTMLSPATSINCASSKDASIDCGVTYWYVVVNAHGRSGRSSLRFSKSGYQHPAFCTLIPTPAFTPPILHKSRMRRRARTDLSGGRSVMSVPTGSVVQLRQIRNAVSPNVKLMGYPIS